MRRSTALAAGWGVCATLVAAAAQQQQPTFRGGVEIFHLDVSVLDKNRRPVPGLIAGDFTVLEDGKPAKIVALTDVELPAALPPPAGWTHEVTPDVTSNQIDERRLFVMVLDDASMPADIRQDPGGRTLSQTHRERHRRSPRSSGLDGHCLHRRQPPASGLHE